MRQRRTRVLSSTFHDRSEIFLRACLLRSADSIAARWAGVLQAEISKVTCSASLLLDRERAAIKGGS
jgi:hypothetical protein